MKKETFVIVSKDYRDDSVNVEKVKAIDMEAAIGYVEECVSSNMSTELVFSEASAKELMTGLGEALGEPRNSVLLRLNKLFRVIKENYPLHRKDLKKVGLCRCEACQGTWLLKTKKRKVDKHDADYEGEYYDPWG
jgi:hypothetical protein